MRVLEEFEGRLEGLKEKEKLRRGDEIYHDAFEERMLPLQFWKLKVNDSKIDKTPVPANSENDETRDDMKVSMSNPSSPSTSPLPTPVSPNANALSVLTDTDSRLKISISDFEISDHVLFLPLPGKSKKHVAFTTDKTRLELNTDGLTIEGSYFIGRIVMIEGEGDIRECWCEAVTT